MFTNFESDAWLGGEAFVVHALPVRLPDPGTPVECGARRSREIGRRVRALEDAWAMHANGANGFGAGETVA